VKPYASYRRLLSNAKSALVAAVEIYNKPAIEYRDEAFAILVVNAWELLLKAVLARGKKDIFYPKKRGEPYRTLSVADALNRARPLLPTSLSPEAISGNVRHLVLFRDNAIHFYNQSDFRVLVYALGQTAVLNFADVLRRVFGRSLDDLISANLLPIGLKPPVDPIAFLTEACGDDGSSSAVVCEFVQSLAQSTARVEELGQDTGRLLTAYTVSLQLTKKVESADFLAGVGAAISGERTLLVEVPKDPNFTHPFREKELLERGLEVGGVAIGQRQFRALVWKYGLKEEPRYCWQAKEGFLTRYSSEVIQFLRKLSAEDVQRALRLYAEHLRNRRKGAG
jgi:EC042_2821-lke REase/Protein of unknown function (DUF3644)